MRLAYICPEMLPLPAIRGGGIETLIDGVTPLISKNHELTVFSVADPDLPSRNKSGGVEYIRFPQHNYRNYIAAYLGRNRPYDVIHVFNRPRNVCLYKRVSPASRFVVSLHNEVFSRWMISDEEGLQCINSVATIITVSNYIGRTVARRFPAAKEKIKTVYSGVDLNRYIPAWKAGERRAVVRKELGLNDKKVILFVGRLLPKKGPHVLIEAFELIRKKYPRAVLIVVGSRWYSDNSEDDYIRKLYRLAEPLKDRVIFTGYVSQAQMPDYYIAADVFVCPSQWQEPLARVHYEAMAAGLPIITTGRGGNPEVITHDYNGIVINNYRNPAAFTDALHVILSKPGLARKFARRGRELAEKRFSFTRVAKDLEEIYRQAFFS